MCAALPTVPLRQDWMKHMCLQPGFHAPCTTGVSRALAAGDKYHAADLAMKAMRNLQVAHACAPAPASAPCPRYNPTCTLDNALCSAHHLKAVLPKHSWQREAQQWSYNTVDYSQHLDVTMCFTPVCHAAYASQGRTMWWEQACMEQ